MEIISHGVFFLGGVEGSVFSLFHHQKVGVRHADFKILCGRFVTMMS